MELVGAWESSLGIVRQNHKQGICRRTVVLSPPTSQLPRSERTWKARIQAPHQLHGIINRIPERVFPCGRWPAIQPRQSPHQKHSGHEIDQFLSAFVHREDKISSSLYVRLAIFSNSEPGFQVFQHLESVHKRDIERPTDVRNARFRCMGM